jgi:hypothetical protein
LATRELPGVGRRHRSTSLYLRKAKPLAKHILPAGACFPRTRLFTISPAMQLTLFDAADALRRKLKNTVSLRRSTMPNDGRKRCAHSALMRGLKDPFACTVLVARQRRVKLTSNFHSSAGRRAGLLRVRNHGDEWLARQQGRCGQTGMLSLLPTTGMSRASIPHVNISSTLCRHILTQYPRCVFSQLAASRGKCSGCGKDGANTSRLNRSKLKKGEWYCLPCSKREVRISRFFFLSLSLFAQATS